MRVLLIDHAPQRAAALTQALTDDGITVTHATSAAAAVQQPESGPELVIVASGDHGMLPTLRRAWPHAHVIVHAPGHPWAAADPSMLTTVLYGSGPTVLRELITLASALDQQRQTPAVPPPHGR